MKFTGTWNRTKSENLSGYLMILPGYAIYIWFVFIPVILTIGYSFTNYDLYKKKDFIGFHNYIAIFQDQYFLAAIKNTTVYSIFMIIPPMAIGMILAVLVNEKFIGQKLSRAAIYIPNITSMVSISMVWLWIFDPAYGLLNVFVKFIGLSPQNWLFNEHYALPSIILVGVWKTIGYNMIIYLAGLQNIPVSQYEAATVDGAGALKRFFSITIPLLQPQTFFLFVMSCINSFNVFEQVNIMTKGGPNDATTTIVHQIYLRAFGNFQMGYASAMSVLLLILTMIITFINFKFSNQGADIEM